MFSKNKALVCEVHVNNFTEYISFVPSKWIGST